MRRLRIRGSWRCRGSRPKVLSPATVWCDDVEWPKIVKHCLLQGIFGVVRSNEVIVHNGKPLLNGVFGVSKNEHVPGTDQDILRMVFNFIPMNGVQEMLAGDVRSLPYIGRWAALELGEDYAIIQSEGDLTSAYYLYQLPPSWLPWTTL